MKKQIEYKGQKATIKIVTSRERGINGRTKHDVSINGDNNTFSSQSVITGELTEDILMSFEASFHNWVENPNPISMDEQILLDNGYTH